MTRLTMRIVPDGAGLSRRRPQIQQKERLATSSRKRQLPGGGGSRSFLPPMIDVPPSCSQAPVVILRRHARARRYTMRINRDGEVMVTVPRGGSAREALRFVETNRDWISRERNRRSAAAGHAAEWGPGTAIWFRGERTPLEVGRLHGRPYVQVAGERIFVADPEVNLRRPVEARLRQLARSILPARTLELARSHGIDIRSVSVRDQASRWGSCSARGVISLNWRLVQAPPEVCDYLIVHELMHRREMNHSARFWRLVATAVPGWRAAEAWLDAHALELGF
jgi:predicted metal-dependent hydrolase